MAKWVLDKEEGIILCLARGAIPDLSPEWAKGRVDAATRAKSFGVIKLWLCN